MGQAPVTPLTSLLTTRLSLLIPVSSEAVESVFTEEQEGLDSELPGAYDGDRIWYTAPFFRQIYKSLKNTYEKFFHADPDVAITQDLGSSKFKLCRAGLYTVIYRHGFWELPRTKSLKHYIHIYIDGLLEDVVARQFVSDKPQCPRLS